MTAELPDLDGLDPQERRRASNRAYNTAYQRQRTAASSRTHRRRRRWHLPLRLEPDGGKRYRLSLLHLTAWLSPRGERRRYHPVLEREPFAAALLLDPNYHAAADCVLSQ